MHSGCPTLDLAGWLDISIIRCIARSTQHNTIESIFFIEGLTIETISPSSAALRGKGNSTFRFSDKPQFKLALILKISLNPEEDKCCCVG